MSVEVLKKACATSETYANIPAGELAAVCAPLALGLPLAKELHAIAAKAAETDPERMISINVAAHGKPLLAAAEKGASPQPAAKKS